MAQFADDNLDALVDAREIPITIDNFNRAATDIEFGKYVALAGGVNKFYHFRDLMPVDAQTTISATGIALQHRDHRYQRGRHLHPPRCRRPLHVGDGHRPGSLPRQSLPRRRHLYARHGHVRHAVCRRLPARAAGCDHPADLAAVHTIQDQMSIAAASSEPFIVPPYDEESHMGLVKAAVGLGAYLPDSFRMFGKKEDVDPVRHFIGTAGGWGGLPEDEALYLGIVPGLPVGEYKIEVPADVPVKDFWSVSVYDANRYFRQTPSAPMSSIPSAGHATRTAA